VDRSADSGDLHDQAPVVVLAVYAHPDDPEVSCAGTLSQWVDGGAEVHLVICARGDKGSSDPATDPDDLARRRAAEADEAARIIGATSHENLGLNDGEVVNDLTLRAELVRRIRALRPDVVVGPDPTPLFFGSSYVNHVDHRQVGAALLDACAPAAASPLYFPGMGPAHRVDTVYLSGTLEPDTHIDISSVMERKVQAVLCHRSQIDDPDEVAQVLRQRACNAGRAAGLPAAESFRVLHPR
jgi:LmbE family N-acetylglucosaminyl deacetylase